MKRTDFQFDLPQDLIAQYPTPERTASRLLYLNRQADVIEDKGFIDVLNLLNPGDLLVMNDTRVIPARLFGKKQSGGRIEVLIERLMEDNQVLAFVRASKSPKVGSQLVFDQEVRAQVIGRHEDLFELKFESDLSLLELLEMQGEIPLPPYMTRDVNQEDISRYQTVFAKYHGAVAAPTAGLHFDENLLQKAQQKGVDLAYVTLHVGAGTFKPMRVDNINEHKMHKERIEVSAAVCDKIRETKKNGGRIIAVGTTVVRSLESAALDGALKPINDETNIFIYPGFTFKVVDSLITNFHLSESTLLMLVSAFASKTQILDAYQHAIQENYRFFSYGDAMFIE